MKAAELKRLLKDIPDDVELVVGDLDSGQFWNPVVRQRRFFAVRRVSEDWAERQLNPVSLFALFNPADQLANESTADPTGSVEVRALNI